MIDAWIIEQIKEKEREQERPFLEIQIDPPPLLEVPQEESPPEEEKRGVIIVELL